MQQNASLSMLRLELCGGLINSEFYFDKREFNPHLTFSSRVAVSNSLDGDEFARRIPAITMQVKKISLIKSEKINGKLTYTEIYAKKLEVQP